MEFLGATPVMTTADIEHSQRATCDRLEAEFLVSPPGSLVVVERRLVEAPKPSLGRWARRVAGLPEVVQGLRNPPDTTDCGQMVSGWWIWSGRERPEGFEDHYVTIHAEHLIDLIADIVPFLGLAPGWTFAIDSAGVEEAWWDEALIDTELDYFERRGLPTPRATKGNAKATYGRILGLP